MKLYGGETAGHGSERKYLFFASAAISSGKPNMIRFIAGVTRSVL